MSAMAAPDPVERAARLLALVLERAPRTEKDVRAELDLVEPELAPLLAPLEHHGLVRREGGRLRPGPAALRFARAQVARAELVEHARASLKRLADESGETVNLMVPTAGGTEAIAQEDGRHLLRATSWIGRDVPDHACATRAAASSRRSRSPVRRRACRRTGSPCSAGWRSSRPTRSPRGSATGRRAERHPRGPPSPA